MNLEMQQRIGTFLRRKREGLAPEDVGLTRHSRARTPGLRREDVAALAGISTIWYSKIERGQVDGISREVLLAISRALYLKPPEHQYLMALAQPIGEIPAPLLQISEGTRWLLDLINPFPAIVINDYFDILAMNRAYQTMCGLDFDVTPIENKNYIGLIFSCPKWRNFLQIDDEYSLNNKLARLVGVLKGISAIRPGDRVLMERICDFLDKSKEFSRIWESELITCPEEINFSFNHALLGPVVLRKQIWMSSNNEATGRLNIYRPIDKYMDGQFSKTTQPA